MNIDDLYKKMYDILPIKQTEKDDFRKSPLKRMLDKFEIVLENVDADDCPNDWSDIKIRVSKLCDAINRAIKESYKGSHAKAFRIIKKQMDGYKSQGKAVRPLHEATYVCIIGKDKDFFRMRIEQKGERKILNTRDMFHIPFEKRRSVKTQRFSVYGHPCLYLGCSIYACWEEMKRPAFDRCIVSRLINQNDLVLVDLRIPNVEMWKKQLSSYVQLYPLLLACMVEVKEEGVNYMPEYIIPQLIMEWIIDKNSSIMKRGKMIHGIIYTSVHKNKDFGYSDEKFLNIAIPTVNTLNNKGFCGVLSKLFKITPPTYYELERLKNANRLEPRISSDTSEDEVRYLTSDFSKLEEYLRLQAADNI